MGDAFKPKSKNGHEGVPVFFLKAPWLSTRLFFVLLAGNTLIRLRDDTGKRRMAPYKPPILSTNSRRASAMLDIL